jgi:uncharacterized coiled-coil protein SlyX
MPEPTIATPSNIPIPDPTLLTTEQLRRELGSLRELVETRLAGMDKATVLLNDGVTRVPTEIDKQISHLKELFIEKFGSVEKQFVERDVRTVAAATAATTAVNAALQAQKEAAGAQNDSLSASIAKSEAATIKQIEGINDLLAAQGAALGDKIVAVSARLDRGEGATSGGASKRNDIMSLVTLAIAGVSIAIALYASMGRPLPSVQITPPTTISTPTATAH